MLHRLGNEVQLDAPTALKGQGVRVTKLPVKVGDALDVAQVIAPLAQQLCVAGKLGADQAAASVHLHGADEAHLAGF